MKTKSKPNPKPRHGSKLLLCDVALSKPVVDVEVKETKTGLRIFIFKFKDESIDCLLASPQFIYESIQSALKDKKSVDFTFSENTYQLPK